MKLTHQPPLNCDACSAELVERVRAEADRRFGPDDLLDFYSVALSLGASPDQAEDIDQQLTRRVMAARGAL